MSEQLERDPRTARDRVRRWQRVWVPVVAGGLAAVVLVAVVVVGRGWLGAPGRVDARTDAATVLNQAADVLDSRDSAPLPTPRPDQWLYTKEVITKVVLGKRTEERWTRFDYEAVAARDDGGAIRTKDDEWVNGHGWTRVFDNPLELYELYRTLPEDPDELVDAIYRLVDQKDLTRLTSLQCNRPLEECKRLKDQPWARDYAAFRLIDRLLDGGAPPAALQADLYRALAEVPGLHNDGMVTDATGHAALAIAWDHKRGPKELTKRYQILLDPKTYRHRGFRVLDYDLVGDNQQFVSIAVTEAGIVDRTSQVP